MATEADAAASEAQAVYTGERKNGRMEGFGTYRFPSGTTYTGEFIDGEFHGEGTYYYRTAKYVGMFEKGLKHGKGHVQGSPKCMLPSRCISLLLIVMRACS